ncbi:MAG TPA: type II secretion system protein GspJ [Burkholderiales bacterium]|nr:type II secretion system protein GspJ [Burkholderiales bacterium]
MKARGFTLVELLTALVILSIVGLMSYRGLAAVVETRERVESETQKWRSLALFFERFEHDLARAAPRKVRSAAGDRPAFIGYADGRVEFSRLAGGSEAPARVAYVLDAANEVELLLWPAADAFSDAQPGRYAALAGVRSFELQYLGRDGAWLAEWPSARDDPALPRAVRVRVVLTSGEDVVRVFAVQS